MAKHTVETPPFAPGSTNARAVRNSETNTAKGDANAAAGDSNAAAGETNAPAPGYSNTHPPRDPFRRNPDGTLPEEGSATRARDAQPGEPPAAPLPPSQRQTRKRAGKIAAGQARQRRLGQHRK